MESLRVKYRALFVEYREILHEMYGRLERLRVETLTEGSEEARSLLLTHYREFEQLRDRIGTAARRAAHYVELLEPP
jgi:hypothetical protein